MKYYPVQLKIIIFRCTAVNKAGTLTILAEIKRIRKKEVHHTASLMAIKPFSVCIYTKRTWKTVLIVSRQIFCAETGSNRVAWPHKSRRGDLASFYKQYRIFNTYKTCQALCCKNILPFFLRLPLPRFVIDARFCERFWTLCKSGLSKSCSFITGISFLISLCISNRQIFSS